jgi:hypothetical protein
MWDLEHVGLGIQIIHNPCLPELVGIGKRDASTTGYYDVPNVSDAKVLAVVKLERFL